MNLFTPAEFTENYAQAGVKKASLPVGKMLLLGMLAGFLIAMGGATASTASHAIPNAGLAKMVSGLLFPFGLAMVILTGAELFTGNVLINISVFEGKTGFGSMLRNWVWVYIGNFCGALRRHSGSSGNGVFRLPEFVRRRLRRVGYQGGGGQKFDSVSDGGGTGLFL